jgi:nucleoside 2-deoxyribosyltransferase
MRSGWQKKVLDAIARMECDVFYLDPRSNDTRKFDEYTALDLYHVRRCDVVFAYLEADNPSDVGLCCEISYAKGLGKTVILVNEHDDHYLKFVESLADIVFDNLPDGISFLQKMQI